MYRIAAALAGVIFLSSCGVIGGAQTRDAKETKIIIQCKDCGELTVTRKKQERRDKDDIYISPSTQ